jgi:phage terminase small subunit
MATNAKVTPRQASFIAEYLVDGNATRAARVAGFSEGSADVTGARLLKNPKVAAALAAAQARLAEKYEVRIERTARKLAEIAYGDIGNLLAEDGSLLPLQRMSEAARTMIAGLDVQTAVEDNGTRTVSHKVKMADRIRALELLGKYQKMFGDGGFGAAVQMPGDMPADAMIKIVLVRPE